MVLARFSFERRGESEVATGKCSVLSRDGPKIQILEIEHQGPDSNLKVNDLLALSEEEITTE